MDKALFETRAITVFNDLKYAFYDKLQQGGTFKQMTNTHYAGLLAVGALLGFPAFGISRSISTDSEINTDIEKLSKLCDLIGINISSGTVALVLFVYGDDLRDEAIVGKCQLIRHNLTALKKFALRIGWNKMPVSAKVFFVFSNSEKAFHFRQNVQDHCKHFAFFNKCWVLPWGIDLAGKSVWAYKGLPVNWLKPAEIESKIFS